MFKFIDKCKHCGKKFFLGFGFKRHLKKCHNEKITKADKKYIRKCRIKFILYPFAMLVWGIYLLLKLICYPFWAFVEYCWTYEQMLICLGRAVYYRRCPNFVILHKYQNFSAIILCKMPNPNLPKLGRRHTWSYVHMFICLPCTKTPRSFYEFLFILLIDFYKKIYYNIYVR